jgi:hypothetical protein
MSTLDDGPTEFVPGETDPNQWIRENREYVERIANSDAPCDWVAQRLLDSVDESETPNESGSSDGEGSL